MFVKLVSKIVDSDLGNNTKTLCFSERELNRLFKAKEDGSAYICSSSSVFRHTRRACQVYRQGKHFGGGLMPVPCSKIII
jgi:hypothetical protein